MNRVPKSADETRLIEVPNDDELDALCDQLMRFDGEEKSIVPDQPKTATRDVVRQ